jgi:nucleotide-binding universal stress UspA family protein
MARELSMFPRDIVVFLDEGPGRQARLAFAANLARRWQAHLIGTFVTRALDLDPYAGYAVGAALPAMLEHYRAEVAATVATARAEFDRIVDHRSFTAEWRVSDNESGEALMLHARHAGLAILGPPARQVATGTMLSLSEDAIFASGRACLLLPVDWPGERAVRHVCIGLNGGREAARAIMDAMPFLVEAQSVHLVVAPEARTSWLSAHDPGADMAAHLARYGVPVVLEQLPGEDAGALLLARCADVDADLLVMGAMGRPRISEFVLGGATRTILASARLPLLVSG